MTKLRAPNSIEDAVFQAVALLGEEAVGKAAGVSASLVRKWSDPDDQAHRIGGHQMLAIDKALRAEHHSPVFAALFLHLENGEPEGVPGNPVNAAVRMTVEASEMLDRVEKAWADGQLDRREIVSIRANAERLQKRIATALKTIYWNQKGARR